MFLRISPPSWDSDRIPDAYVPRNKLRLKHLALWDKLKNGATINAGDTFNERIANSRDPGTDKGREESTNQINEGVAHDFVDLLNAVQPFVEHDLHTESDFELIDTLPEGAEVSQPRGYANHFVVEES
jgi:hypothetical protein